MAHQACAYLQFLWHEVTKCISSPPWIGCKSIAGLPPALNLPLPIIPIHLGGERHSESKVSCLKTQHNVPGQGLNPNCLNRSQAPTIRPPCLSQKCQNEVRTNKCHTSCELRVSLMFRLPHILTSSVIHYS